jgi:hypothetical protein
MYVAGGVLGALGALGAAAARTLVFGPGHRIRYYPGSRIPPGWVVDAYGYYVPPPTEIPIPVGYYVDADGYLMVAADLNAAKPIASEMSNSIAESLEAKFQRLTQDRKNIEDQMDALSAEMNNKCQLEKTAQIADSLTSTQEYDRAFAVGTGKAHIEAPLDALFRPATEKKK